ncbi:MAG: hypothetical protein RIT81_45310 [Deltaproteobacteria bacterium]
MKRLLLPVLLALAPGCIHQAVAIAPSSEPLAPGSYEKIGRVSGQDCLWKLFGLIPVTTGNTLGGAMSDAIAERPNTDALVQVTADAFTQYWVVISRECTQVDGVAVRVSK